ncbi:hypothetical protein CEE34_06755 [Candidatus Aerophobetes bacterium Ae_b3a]|nr:MAG: hypothetical protein CEE34_06755 [Candidatus Aerophobetes bacterium Ae_b3a]
MLIYIYLPGWFLTSPGKIISYFRYLLHGLTSTSLVVYWMIQFVVDSSSRSGIIIGARHRETQVKTRKEKVYLLSFILSFLLFVFTQVITAETNDVAKAEASAEDREDVAKVEVFFDNLVPEMMEKHHVPGVSIALINDYRVEWAKGYGVLETGKSQRVTPETLFQSGSVGKLVVAMTALHYVERGLIELDADVNRSLISWQVPENEFTVKEKVTLRRLLSHSAGLTATGFRGYAQGEEIPNLQQILNGEPPANSAPIRVDTIPGTQYRYSNGGYMVVQQLLEDVTDIPLSQTVKDIILEPYGMTASTFESPLPENLWAIAASGHRDNGTVIPGGWHVYPEMGPGASMWTTPSDLAAFATGIMLAYAGRSDEVLSQDMAMEMLSAQIENRGLGPVIGDDGGDLFYFSHPGATEGRKSLLVAYPKKGQGVVIMANSDSGEALWHELLRSVSVEYGWLIDRTYLYSSVIIAVVLVLLGLLLLRRRRARRRSG